MMPYYVIKTNDASSEWRGIDEYANMVNNALDNKGVDIPTGKTGMTPRRPPMSYSASREGAKRAVVCCM